LEEDDKIGKNEDLLLLLLLHELELVLELEKSMLLLLSTIEGLADIIVVPLVLHELLLLLK
jgi:hypothetical protein